MTDVIDIGSVVLTGGADVRDWPATTAITALTTSAGGLEPEFSAKHGATWPDITPAGWDGPVYYTVWLGAATPDGVHLAASLNVFRGQPAGAGAGDVTNIGQYSQNLWYLDPALKAHVVTEGETLYLMVTAGGLRGVSAVSVQERSNIVAFTASSAPKTFTYTTAPPVEPPVDPPAPPVVPPASDVLAAVLEQLARIEAAVNKPAPIYECTLPVHGYVATLNIVLKPRKD